MTVLLILQVSTYIGLGSLFLLAGNWKLGIAQLLLAGVQGLVFA